MPRGERCGFEIKTRRNTESAGIAGVELKSRISTRSVIEKSARRATASCGGASRHGPRGGEGSQLNFGLSSFLRIKVRKYWVLEQSRRTASLTTAAIESEGRRMVTERQFSGEGFACVGASKGNRLFRAPGLTSGTGNDCASVFSFCGAFCATDFKDFQRMPAVYLKCRGMPARFTGQFGLALSMFFDEFGELDSQGAHLSSLAFIPEFAIREGFVRHGNRDLIRQHVHPKVAE
jgi:hypothetical protein